ncbi:hypothetical protein [Vibrio diabolicus]|uniref:hypothetical protein n=1 Tax=Vibrio diabolicus TaxID=50719 RepID=UPI0023314F1E|nr:hypothetical protein [Vibrio diabolicus]
MESRAGLGYLWVYPSLLSNKTASVFSISSAAAVAASALWQLGEISNNQRYKQRASDILSSLLVPKYFYMDTDTPALLKLASGNVPAGREVNTSLIYADYYFIEALLLQLGYIDWRL